MKKKNLICLLLTSIILTTFSLGYARNIEWDDICPDSDVVYCKNVGKYAYGNPPDSPSLRNIKLGKIIGVTRIEKGGVVDIPEAKPEAGMKKEIKRSSRAAYYYIIDDGRGEPFLRQCREIRTK